MPDGASERHDGWLLSFIDILALLLTLFVLLLAYQDRESDQARPDVPESQPEIAETVMAPAVPPAKLPVHLQSPIRLHISIPNGFLPREESHLPLDAGAVSAPPVGVAMDPPSAPVDVPAAETGAPVRDDAVKGNEISAAETQAKAMQPAGELAPAADATSESMETAEAVSDTVDKFLRAMTASGLNEQMQISVHTGIVNLEIRDNILFAPGSAALTEEGIALLNELAALLLEQPFILSVEGHTDSIPIDTARYPSNWELSSARAAIVTRSLIGQGIAPDRLRAIGYGDTRPLADNRTPEGRSTNRRVSFVLQIPSYNMTDLDN